MLKINSFLFFALCIFAILLIGDGIVSSEETRAIDEVKGFRGLQWGMQLPKDTFDYIRTDPSYGGVEIYVRKNENLKVGKTVVESIEYGIWKDKFCHVLMRGEGDNEKFLQIKEAVFKKFGKRNRRDKYTERYVWSGKDTWILLKYRREMGDGIFYMASQKIKNQQKRYNHSDF